MNIPRRRLVIIFVGIAGLLLAGFVFWYLPHRPTSVMERALLKSLKQRSVSFTITGDEVSTQALRGQIDKQGDSSVELRKDGRQITIITVEEAAFINGGDERWLEVPLESARALSGQPAGLQPVSLKAADRKRIERLYDKHGFIEVVRVFDEEPVAGKTSYHYRIRAGKEQLRAFLEAARRDIPELEIQADQIAAILGADLLNRSLDIWIDKKEGVVRQAMYIQNANNKVYIRFDGYGKDIDITKPQLSTPLLETLRR